MSFEVIDKGLKTAGVDTSQFGFYDQPAFLSLERRNPKVLDNYAKWVISRPRTAEYDEHVRAVVPKVAGLIEKRLERENAVAACLNVATMAVSMLNRLGVWSVAVRGALTVDVPSKPSLGVRYFPHMDLLDNPDNITGHGWLVAPPFMIVDATVKHQKWVGLPAEFARLLPSVVLAEDTRPARPKWIDLIGDAVIRVNRIPARDRNDRLPYLMNPDLAVFERDFPGVEIASGDVRLRYFASANTVSDGPLEGMQWVSPERPNLKPIHIWDEDIRPAFGL